MRKEIPNTLKVTTRLRYPKQINFTSSFLNRLESEYKSLMYSASENTEAQPTPVLNYREKFIKAINFYLAHLK
jgi:hypothetical protein